MAHNGTREHRLIMGKKKGEKNEMDKNCILREQGPGSWFISKRELIENIKKNQK